MYKIGYYKDIIDRDGDNGKMEKGSYCFVLVGCC